MKKTTFSRVLLLLTACLVVALSCFILTLIPKSAVAAEEKTVVAGTDFTLSGTPADGVSIIDSSASVNGVNTPSFMAGTYASSKIYINGFTRMKATVVNFTEPVDVNAYDTFSTTFSITASNFNMYFAFYPNVAGTVVGQTDNAGTYVSSAAASGTKLALAVNLKPFADEDGMVSSFILVHATDNRPDGDYQYLNISVYDGTLTKSGATSTYVPGTDYTVSSISFAQKADGVTYPTEIGKSGDSIYVNAFKRLCATVVYLNKPISAENVYSFNVSFSKAMGDQTQFDFYQNIEGVTVGDLSDSKHTVISTAANGIVDNTTIRVADLADSSGVISSFIIVHTTDNRGDNHPMAFKLYNITTTSVDSVTADNVLALDGVDIVNGTSNATNNVSFMTSVEKGKMFANNLFKGYAATVKFGNPIDINLWKTLELRLNIMGISNKYSLYLDLFKAGATDFSHNSADARYTVLNSRDENSEDKAFVSGLVINLADFANEQGLVESITIVNYDNSGDKVNAGNLSVFESYLSTEAFEDYQVSDGEYTLSMPEKTAENKAFVGWDIGGKLYAPFSKYTGETATATPVYVEFFMEEGASIRVDLPAGLRFSSYFSASDLEALESSCTFVNLFTWITSPNSTKELEILRQGSWIEEGSLVKFNGVMVGIDKTDYTRTFIGRSFMEIAYEDTTVVRILSVGSHIERTVAYVAQEAIEDGECANDTDKLAILKKFAGIA